MEEGAQEDLDAMRARLAVLNEQIDAACAEEDYETADALEMEVQALRARLEAAAA